MTAAFNDANFASQVLNNDKLTVVDVWATWCGPCRAIAPMMEQLAEEYKGKATIGKLNLDENPETGVAYGITSIPAVLFIKNGKLVDKQVGAVPKAVFAKKIEANL